MLLQTSALMSMDPTFFTVWSLTEAMHNPPKQHQEIDIESQTIVKINSDDYRKSQIGDVQFRKENIEQQAQENFCAGCVVS